MREAELEVRRVQRQLQDLKRAFHRAMGRFTRGDGVLPVHPLRGGDLRGRLPHHAGAGWTRWTLITFSLYITTFVNPVRKLSTFAELFANGTAGFARFVELMREEPAIQDAPRCHHPFPGWRAHRRGPCVLRLSG